MLRSARDAPPTSRIRDVGRRSTRRGWGDRGGDVEPRCSQEHSRAAEAALPDARNDLCDELGQNPRSSGRSGTAEIKTRLNLLQLVERSQVVAGYRADVQTGAETLLYVQLDAPIWSPAV